MNTYIIKREKTVEKIVAEKFYKELDSYSFYIKGEQIAVHHNVQSIEVTPYKETNEEKIERLEGELAGLTEENKRLTLKKEKASEFIGKVKRKEISFLGAKNILKGIIKEADRIYWEI